MASGKGRTVNKWAFEAAELIEAFSLLEGQAGGA